VARCGTVDAGRPGSRARVRREQIDRMEKRGVDHVPSLEVLERVAWALGKKIDLKVREAGRA